MTAGKERGMVRDRALEAREPRMLAAERDFAGRKGRVGNRGRRLYLQCGRAGDGRLIIFGQSSEGLKLVGMATRSSVRL
jgi:hypothetical protein